MVNEGRKKTAQEMANTELPFVSSNAMPPKWQPFRGRRLSASDVGEHVASLLGVPTAVTPAAGNVGGAIIGRLVVTVAASRLGIVSARREGGASNKSELVVLLPGTRPLSLSAMPGGDATKIYSRKATAGGKRDSCMDCDEVEIGGRASEQRLLIQSRAGPPMCFYEADASLAASGR